jgi:opacity protein-like surface antigen
VRTSLIALLPTAIATCVFAGSATAAERGFYAGGFYGEAESELEEAPFAGTALLIYDDFGFAPQDVRSSFETSDSAYSFFAGYRWLRNLAFEVGYLDLGSVEYVDQASGIYLETGEPENWNQKITSSTGGFTLSALGILPLNYRMEAFARGGVLLSSGELRYRVSDGIGSVGRRGSKSDVDLLAGAGLAFTFAEIYSLRLEYQRVFDAGDAGTGEADADLYALGISVVF